MDISTTKFRDELLRNLALTVGKAPMSLSLLGWLTDASRLTPHGFCLLWEPGLLATYAGSDIASALSYYSIPIGLLYYAFKRPDVHRRGLIVLFGLFILACGTDHILSAVTLWFPLYHAEAVTKTATALLSLITASLVWPVLPKLIRAPSVDELEAVNKKLNQSLAAQYETTALLLNRETELVAAHNVLDMRVKERTAELEQSHDILRRDEARFRVVVEAAPNALLMVNGQGIIEMLNTEAETTFGYNRAELLGSAVDRLLPERFRAHYPEFRKGVLGLPKRMMGADGGVFARRKDGTEFEAEIGLSPIETEYGPMVIASIVDISGRLKIEAQLQQAQRMEAMGIITAGVAHDFNNLLQAMRGSLEVLSDYVGENGEAKEYFDIALNASRRGGDLTHRLLSFSRQQVLTPVMSELGALLEETRALAANLFKNSNSTLSVEVGTPELRLLVDPGELNAALINLTVNALDAMPQGGKLEIRATQRVAAGITGLRDGPYVVISVVDQGDGMSPETLAHAFEPFFTTKGVFGSGLGLSMVQGFARQSGGDCQISSMVGQGTTIDIWLPLADATRPVFSAADAPHSKLPPRRVLLADDAPDVLVTVGAFLKGAGLVVTRVASARHGLATLAAGNRFDLLISDFAMPGMNGAEFITQARDIQPSLPALIITGFQAPIDFPKSENVAVIQKPFGRVELLSLVETILALQSEEHATA